MVIPIYDNDPLEQSHRAYVNWALLITNIAVFLVQINASDDTSLAMTRDLALIPAAITGKVTLGGNLPPILSVFTYMFLHGGWSHIIGNMLFLWVLGDNIEDAFGSVRFFFFYMLCGAAGGLAHLFMHPDSVAPLVGASGAVAGVVAAYLHLARTICRRAERVIVQLKDSGEEVSAEVRSYINRLSDFLFVASRYLNDKGARDVLWVPGANR